MQNSNQQLTLTSIQNSAFNVRYSPFRLLNIKYTEASTQRQIEEPIRPIEHFSIQLTLENQTIKPVKFKKIITKEAIKIVSIDLKKQKQKQKASKENLSDYNRKLIDDINRIEQEILTLS